MPGYKLFREIGVLSTDSRWELAKQEWDLSRIYEVPEGEESQECLCGKYPIREVCVLINRLNKNVVEVGNHCVDKFFEIPSDRIFSGIKRVRKDITKSLPHEVLEYAYQKNIIDERAFDFYLDTRNKKKYSEKQMAYKVSINKRILRNLDLKEGIVF